MLALREHHLFFQRTMTFRLTDTQGWGKLIEMYIVSCSYFLHQPMREPGELGADVQHVA